MDVAQVKRVLPHRYPMLLVDAVDELVPGERLVARKAVTANEPWYADLDRDADHSYPEVLLVESWCQSAGVLAAWDRPNPDVLSGEVMLFGAITDIRFHRPVRPGDVVEHRVRLARAVGGTSIFEGESLVGGVEVMTVTRVVMASRPAGELAPPAAETPAATAASQGQDRLRGAT